MSGDLEDFAVVESDSDSEDANLQELGKWLTGTMGVDSLKSGKPFKRVRSELIATDTEREDMGRPKTPTQPQTHAKVPVVKRITELTELVYPPAATVTEVLGAQDGIDTAESSSQGKGQEESSILVNMIQERERLRMHNSSPTEGEDNTASQGETQQVPVEGRLSRGIQMSAVRPRRRLNAIATCLRNAVARIRRPRISPGNIQITWECVSPTLCLVEFYWSNM